MNSFEWKGMILYGMICAHTVFASSMLQLLCKFPVVCPVRTLDSGEAILALLLGLQNNPGLR